MIDDKRSDAPKKTSKKKWQCICKYFDSKFAPNVIVWSAFLVASICYDFIIKTSAASKFGSQLSFQDMASKIDNTFVIISIFQFFLLILLILAFLAFDSKKTAGQILDVEVSTITSIANLFFVTAGNFWIVNLVQNKDVQSGLINPWEYFGFGVLALVIAAILYWFGCNTSLVGDISGESVDKQPSQT